MSPIEQNPALGEKTDTRVLTNTEAAGSIALIGSDLNPVPGVNNNQALERIEPGQRIRVEMPADPSGALGYNVPVIRR